MIRQMFSTIMLLFALLTAGVQAHAQAAPAAQAASSEAAAYILGPDDEIAISVVGQDNLSVTRRIKADGTIMVPYLDAVQAAGKNTAQLGSEIADAYSRGGYLTNPSVNVEVTTYASKSVTVLGAVPNAGLYPLDRPYSVAAMIAKAGGTRTDGANSVILTPAGGKETMRISLADLRGGAARLLQPGDTLFVPAAEQVYVYGQVTQPGAFPFLPGMTFRQALAKAGGPTLAGSTRKIEVRREGKKIPVQLDDPAQPEDVLIIKEKLF